MTRSKTGLVIEQNLVSSGFRDVRAGGSRLRDLYTGHTWFSNTRSLQKLPYTMGWNPKGHSASYLVDETFGDDWKCISLSPASAGDANSIPESGRSPAEGNGNPLQYSCLGNPTDRGAAPPGVAKHRMWLSDWTTNIDEKISKGESQLVILLKYSVHAFIPLWNLTTTATLKASLFMLLS